MSKEKKSYTSISTNNSEEKLTQIHTSKPTASDIENMKKAYLPDSKTDYHPSEESIECANGLDYSKPNPVATLVANSKNNNTASDYKDKNANLD